MISGKLKKKLHGKCLVWVIAAMLILSACSLNYDSGSVDREDTTPPATTQDDQTADIPTENTEDDLVGSEDDSKDTEEPPEEPLTFELVAGEAGEYGELFTINAGTEFEETYYIYHIPAGTYTVTNTGEYMTQLNVYSDEMTVNDAGWEEPADGFCKLVDVGASVTVTIPEGYFIEIHEPTRFTFTAEASGE